MLKPIDEVAVALMRSNGCFFIGETEQTKEQTCWKSNEKVKSGAASKNVPNDVFKEPW